jgi:hypothetical protein
MGPKSETGAGEGARSIVQLGGERSDHKAPRVAPQQRHPPTQAEARAVGQTYRVEAAKLTALAATHNEAAAAPLLALSAQYSKRADAFMAFAGGAS